MISVNTWSLDYVLAVPSIITSDNTTTDYETLVWDSKLVYDWFKNLPYTYSWTKLNIDGWFMFQPTNVSVYSWFLDNLSNNKEKAILFKNLQTAFTWSDLSKSSEFDKILSLEVDLNSPSNELVFISTNILNSSLNLELEKSSLNDSVDWWTWSSPDPTIDLNTYYWIWSDYVSTWSLNQCDISNMTTEVIQPWVDTIPSSLAEKYCIFIKRLKLYYLKRNFSFI